jgi:hypothetical protein
MMKGFKGFLGDSESMKTLGVVSEQYLNVDLKEEF